MSWFIEILTPGPAFYFATSSLSSHLYVYQEEAPSGHSSLYLGSPHFNGITDPTRAIYRGRSLIAIFNSIQRLSNDSIWSYDESSVYGNNRRYNLSLKDENIALEELANPFQNLELTVGRYNNQYHQYLNLASIDNLVYNVLLSLDDAYKYAPYFYINLFKIVETIENDWTLNVMSQQAPDAKNAFDYLNRRNIRGYMNQFMASGLFSRHGFTSSTPAAPTILNPPPVQEIKENLLLLINKWLNYKIAKTLKD